MYAIIKNGSHQYRIHVGQFIKIEKSDLNQGQNWTCEQVLVFQNEEGQFIIGAPYIEKAIVNGKVIRHGKDKKILVFKKKRRKGYRRTQGHRQGFTEIYIESIVTPSGKAEKKFISSRVKSEDKLVNKTEVISKGKITPSITTKPQAQKTTGE